MCRVVSSVLFIQDRLHDLQCNVIDIVSRTFRDHMVFYYLRSDVLLCIECYSFDSKNKNFNRVLIFVKHSSSRPEGQINLFAQN